MAYGDIDNQVQAYESKGIAALKQMQQSNPKLLAGIAIENLQRELESRERGNKMGAEPAGASVIDKKLGSQQAIAAASPGLAMQGQRMQGQQLAQQLNSAPKPGGGLGGLAPSGQGMAGGGIVEYAEGKLVAEKPTLGAMPQNVVSPDQIKQDAETYQNLKAGLAAAKTPEGKARVQMQLDALIMNMGNEHAKVMQYIDSTKGFVHPRSQMAGGGIVSLQQGGEIKKYQEGEFVVGIEGEESPLTADGDEYRFNDELISAEEYAELARQINRAGLPVNNNKRADWNRGRAAPGAVLDVVKENIRGVGAELDGGMDSARNAYFDLANRGAEGLLNLVNYTPSDTSLENAEFVGFDKVAEGLGMQSAAQRAAAEAAAETRRVEGLNAANIEALGVAEEESSPKTLAEMLMRAQEQFDANPPAKVQENKDGDKDGDKDKKGIADLMRSDKAASILDVIRKLGYAGGASKGYEGQALFQGMQAERDAETKAGRERDMLDAELEGRTSLMKEENKMRIAAQQGVAAADYQSTLTDQYLMSTKAYTDKKKALLAEKGGGIFNILTDDEEEDIANTLTNFIAELRSAEMRTYTGMLSQFSGANSQTGVSEQPPSVGETIVDYTDVAQLNPQ